MGRPRLPVNRAICDEICYQVAHGSNLHRLCEIDADHKYPDLRTVYRWLDTDVAFAQAYARARESRADARADRIDEISQQVIDGELDPQAARVVIDAEKWQAAHEQPRKYGDKIGVGQADGLDPVAVKSDDGAAARVAIEAALARLAPQNGDTKK